MTFLLRISIIVLGLVLIWQAIINFWHVPDYLLPSPLQVANVLYQQRELISSQAIPTIIEMMVGFFLGILFGCFAGFCIAFFRPLKYWFLPMLIISQAIPTFAIAPLLVVWLGYGMASKVATTVLMIFFPVASAFYDGLQRTEKGWLDLATTMNAKKWRSFYYIQLPASLPELSSGIRIAAAIAPIGTLVGEWVGSSQGLGYLMLNANARLQIDVMFAALMIVIILAVLLYFIVDKLLCVAIWWQPNHS